MSLVPEFIFRAILVRGIRAIRQDTRVLDLLFRNLDAQSTEEMRDFFLNNKISIDLNYPRDTLKLPAIVILLKSENESQAFLSDFMGLDQVPDALSYDTFEDSTLAGQILGGAATVSSSDGLGPVVYGPATASGGTANTITISEFGFKPDSFLTSGHTVHIIGGTGAGQQRDIVANGQSNIMVSPNWLQIPDNTSVFVVRREAGELIGYPRAVETRENAPLVESLGSYYDMNLQMQIIGPNQEFTIYLHTIVRSILTLSRQVLEQQCILNMKLGATDFMPRTEYQPDYAYMRALNINFVHPFQTFAQINDVAESFRVVLETCDPDGLVVNVSDRFV